MATANMCSLSDNAMTRASDSSVDLGAVAAAVAPAAPAAAETCENLTVLEPAAMMGKLSDGQVACLEASLAAATKQTPADVERA